MSTREDLLAFGSATLGESGALRMHPRMRPVWRGARVAAPAFTAQCTAGDNLAIHVGVTRAPEGSVLCASVGDVRELGYWGEVLTTAAEAGEIEGLVIDGCVRDVDALEAHGFAVFSTGIALTGAQKKALGTTGAPVRIGDVEVATGDWVVGDVDGVVVVPALSLADVLDAAQARTDKERSMFDDLRAGRTTLELLGLDASLIEEH